MPALTISSVNTGTDELTVTAHGLLTGDGPAAVRVIGGTLPAPLAAATDYWWITTGVNTGKLATSSANALANTAINLTTAGSGTLKLEIGIPYRRARTYVPKSVDAPGSQVKSVDLNALQDALVAIHEVFTGQPQTVWDAATIAGALVAGGLTLPANQHVTISGTGEYKHGDRVLPLGPAAFQLEDFTSFLTSLGSASGTWDFTSLSQRFVRANLHLMIGDRIKSVLWVFSKASSSSNMVMSVNAQSALAPATLTPKDTLTDASNGAGFISVNRTGINYTVAANEYPVLRVSIGDPAHRISGAFVTYDHP